MRPAFRLDEFKTFFRVSRVSMQSLQDCICEKCREQGITGIIESVTQLKSRPYFRGQYKLANLHGKGENFVPLLIPVNCLRAKDSHRETNWEWHHNGQPTALCLQTSKAHNTNIHARWCYQLQLPCTRMLQWPPPFAAEAMMTRLMTCMLHRLAKRGREVT